MTDMGHAEYLRWFTGLHLNHQLFSTGATEVNYAGILYNVTKSTKDPKKIPGLKGKSWKTILARVADIQDAECYVTNQKPKDGEGNHPDYEVGGHMTPVKSGVVEKGGDSYLMPLCKWHNSTKRNEKPFEHTETKMVKLTGFMEGDSALTFMMRMPSEEVFSALYLDPTTRELNFVNLPNDAVLNQNLKKTLAPSIKNDVDNFVLFERDSNENSMYRVKEVVLE